MNIYEYAKLQQAEKVELLKEDGLFLEKFQDNDHTVFMYYLEEFFVELIIKDGKIVDIIPYKKGYKLNKTKLHEIEKRNMLYGMAA